MSRLVVLVSLVAASASAEPLSFAEAVRRGVTVDPSVQAADAVIAGQVAGAKRARAGYGPRVGFEAQVLRWDSALESSFGDIPGVPIEVPALEVREPTTWTITATIAQPLAAIWTIYESHSLAKQGIAIAEIQREATQRRRAARVAEAYLRALQADAFVAVARTSVEQRQATVERTQVLRDREVVADNELLRARLGLSEAEARLIEAEARLRLARSQLSTLLGLPPSAPLDLEPVPLDASEAPPLEPLLERAMAQRIELTEVSRRIEQAGTGVRLAWSRMLPNVNLVGTYQHNGGSAFQQENAFFVGLIIDWTLWEWGGTWYGIEEAEAGLAQVRAAVGELKDAIRLEVEAAWTQLRTARAGLALAQESLVPAEEHLRLQRLRFDEQAATAFDVIDAETQLTQARLRLEAGRFDVAVARLALLAATGATVQDIIEGAAK